MDTLGLQAALVKLDPATTVTPIGSSVKLMPRHRPSFEVDETDLTLRNVLNTREDEKSHNHLHHHHHNHHQKSIGTSSTETSSSGQSTFRKLQIGNNESVGNGVTSSSAVSTVLSSGTNNHHQNNHKNSSSSSTSSSQKIVTTKCTISEVR